MKKKAKKQEYHVDITKLVKRTGEFKPGITAYGEVAYYGHDALNQNMVSRIDSSSAPGGFAEMMAASFPYDDKLGGDEVTTKVAGLQEQQNTVNPTQLRKLGYVLHNRLIDPEHADAIRVLAEKKTGKKAFIFKKANGDETYYDVWVKKYGNTGEFEYAEVAQFQEGVVKTAALKKKYFIPQGTTKIAFDYAVSLGLVKDMRYEGFNMYKEADAGHDPDGIWWKEKVDGPDGTPKYYLVKQKGVVHAKDAGGNKVEAIVGKHSKEANAKKTVKMASKVRIKTAAAEDREESKNTAATLVSNVPEKNIDVVSGDWKSKIAEYLKKCEKNGIKPKTLQVKVIDYMTEGDTD